MLMGEPTRWAADQSEDAYAEGISSGSFVEVTRAAPGWFRGQPVAVEVSTFDKYVAWDGSATRRLGVHLEETRRLEVLLLASGCAATSSGGCFICKAVDARGFECVEHRHVLTMSNCGQPASPRWLIHE